MSKAKSKKRNRVEKQTANRRWESAQTSRLNEAQWYRRMGETLNHDIHADLETLRRRSRYEYANNPWLKGIVNTHASDVIGVGGPTLHVMSSSDEYNEQAEDVFWRWAERADVRQRQSLPDMMRVNWIQLWTEGDFLNAITNGWDEMPRLFAINPARLQTPPGKEYDNVVLGIEFSKQGAPTGYYIQKVNQNPLLWNPTWDYDRIDARNMIHGFRIEEPDQARGYPWLATVLQTAADLRSYDKAVLDAARQFAEMALLLTSSPPADLGVDFTMAVGETEMEPRTMKFLPPYYTAEAIKAEQPTTSYKEFRNERLREFGRSVSMPLMVIGLDSSGHNYSSARFDDQIYMMAIKEFRRWMEQVMLDRVADVVLREAELAEIITARRPADFRLEWTWPVKPHVDRTKEANADKLRLAAGTTSLTRVCEENGTDFDTVLEERRREFKMLRESGIPMPEFLSEAMDVMAGEPNENKELATAE